MTSTAIHITLFRSTAVVAILPELPLAGATLCRPFVTKRQPIASPNSKMEHKRNCHSHRRYIKPLLYKTSFFFLRFQNGDDAMQFYSKIIMHVYLNKTAMKNFNIETKINLRQCKQFLHSSRCSE